VATVTVADPATTFSKDLNPVVVDDGNVAVQGAEQFIW
jgi:hypothetical protein